MNTRRTGTGLPVDVSTTTLSVVHVAEIVRGGIGTYLRVLLPLQAERYREGRVAVIAPSDEIIGLHLPPEVLTIGFPPQGRRLTRAIRAFILLRRLLGRHGSDVIHLHSTFAGFVCRIGLFLNHTRPPVVYCAHGWAFDRDSRTNSLVRLIERALSRSTNAIVCISEHDRQSAIDAGMRREKVVVIHNGLPDVGNSPPVVEPIWAESTLRLLFVGRFDRQKGLDVLVEALSQVQRLVQLHVFGERVVGEPFDVSMPYNVELHGWADFETIHPYLSSCHALVIPSRWEGLGITAIEAMRGGKAVIASRVGGLPEVVEDGETGILLPRGDIAKWVEALESVTTQELEAMGKRGRERYERYFTVERMERAVAKLYTSCVQGSRP